MAHIQVLDKHTAELIAAGEVVERPSSVIKELVENAIDADATTITVEIEQGGVALMKITDNGSGIAHEEVPTAFLRHATSKIRTEADLDAIGTLGFRGEALASIAAVSHMEVITCTADEQAGTHYVMAGGEPVENEEIGCPTGTTMVVRDLFYNVPARMKFLKKDVTEGNAVAAVVDRLALSHPDISFRFIRDGREELLTPGDSRLYSCIYTVLGKEFAKGLLPVEYTLAGVHVHGYISAPASSRRSRAMQHFFINGRYVKTRTAMAALEQAFKGSIMVGKFPACVLNIDLPAEVVDANVHPAKIEVRFVNEKPVFDAVYHAVRSALQSGDQPLQASLSTGAVRPPKAEPSAPMPQGEQLHIPLGNTPATAMRQQAAQPLPPEPPQPMAPPVSARPTAPAVPPRSMTSSLPDMTSLYSERRGKAPEMAVHAPHPDIVRTTPPVTETPAAPSSAAQTLELTIDEPPAVRYIGEAFSTYILAEMGDAVFIIDKHAAHERILYNQLKKNARVDEQILLQPVSVSPGREAAAVLLDNRALLAEAGFEVADFGGGTLLVRTVPMMLDGEDVPALMDEIAEGFLNGGQSVHIDKQDWIYHSTACRAAIKGGDKSRPEELERLAERVLLQDDIRYCPHGRPVCVEVPRREWEKQFGRIV